MKNLIQKMPKKYQDKIHDIEKLSRVEIDGDEARGFCYIISLKEGYVLDASGEYLDSHIVNTMQELKEVVRTIKSIWQQS